MTPQPAPETVQIFLSYAREDRAHADAIASALRRHGWSVWWDPKIRLGTSYQSAIEAALDAALCVVVLWSAHAKASQWVKEEAQSGLDRGILIPVLVENVQAPLGFRSLQAAELTGWDGDASHPEFQKLVEHVEALLGPGSSPAPRVVADPPPERLRPPPRTPSEPPPAIGFVWKPAGDPSTPLPQPPVRIKERHGSRLVVALVGIPAVMGLYGFLILLRIVLPDLLWLGIVGLIGGVIAKLIIPGRDPGDIIDTIMLGIAGSLLGWFIFGGSDGLGPIGAAPGALILLFIYRLIVSRRPVA